MDCSDKSGEIKQFKLLLFRNKTYSYIFLIYKNISREGSIILYSKISPNPTGRDDSR